MSCCINDLMDKEVINVCDGKRLGYAYDVEVDVCDGKILSLIVSSECSGLFSKSEEFCIPWKCVKSVGNDIIIVETQEVCRRNNSPDECSSKKKKRGWF